MGSNEKRKKKSSFCSYRSVCNSITPYWNHIIFTTIFSLQTEFLILGYCLFIYLIIHSALAGQKNREEKERYSAKELQEKTGRNFGTWYYTTVTHSLFLSLG